MQTIKHSTLGEVVEFPTYEDGVRILMNGNGKFFVEEGETNRQYDTLEKARESIERKVQAAARAKKLVVSIPVYAVITRRSRWGRDSEIAVDNLIYAGINRRDGSTILKTRGGQSALNERDELHGVVGHAEEDAFDKANALRDALIASREASDALMKARMPVREPRDLSVSRHYGAGAVEIEKANEHVVKVARMLGAPLDES